jgi:acyl carrier protein
MNQTELQSAVFQLTQDELGVDLARIDPDIEIRQQLDIDSLQLIRMYAAVVEYFQIDVPMSIMGAKTLREILDCLASEMNALGAVQ